MVHINWVGEQRTTFGVKVTMCICVSMFWGWYAYVHMFLYVLRSNNLVFHILIPYTLIKYTNDID